MQVRLRALPSSPGRPAATPPDEEEEEESECMYK